MDNVNIAVIGVGNMGSNHTKSLYEEKVKNAKLYAVCDINPERLEWAKENFIGIKTYLSFDDVVADEQVDAVLIATPHYLHPAMGKKLLRQENMCLLKNLREFTQKL